MTLKRELSGYEIVRAIEDAGGQIWLSDSEESIEVCISPAKELLILRAHMQMEEVIEVLKLRRSQAPSYDDWTNFVAGIPYAVRRIEHWLF